MKLTSMKKKIKTTLRGALKTDMPEEAEQPYPWGLEISLDQDSIKKLNLDIENMSAGDDVFFVAKAKVTRISTNENVDSATGKTDKNGDIGLQIQQMGWGRPGID